MDIFRGFLKLLYKGPAKRVFRGLLHRVFDYGKDSEVRILAGPLRGMRFSGRQAHQLGLYECAIERVIVDNLEPGNAFYDIGANVGYFSLLAARICTETGHVYCFEPVPTNVAKIERNLDVNNIDNYTIIDKAVSDTIGSSQFTVSDGTKSSLDFHEKGDQIIVNLITLDEFVKTNRMPHLVKVDIEGAEKNALRGAMSLVNHASPPMFIIELHDEENESIVTDLLTTAGFLIKEIFPEIARKSRFPYHILAKKHG